MFAGGRAVTAGGSMNTVMVPEHGGSAQQLKRAQERVAAKVEHGEMGPAESDFNKDEADLRLGSVGKRGLRIGTSAMHEGAQEGGGGADENHDTRCEGRRSDEGLDTEEQVGPRMNGNRAVENGA